MKTKDDKKIATQIGSLQVDDYCAIQFYNHEIDAYEKKQLSDDEAYQFAAGAVAKQVPLLEEGSRKELAQLTKDILIKKWGEEYHFSVVTVATCQVHKGVMELTVQSTMSIRNAQNDIIAEKTMEPGDNLGTSQKYCDVDYLSDLVERLLMGQVQYAASIAKSLAENGIRMEDVEPGQDEEKEEIPFA